MLRAAANVALWLSGRLLYWQVLTPKHRGANESMTSRTKNVNNAGRMLFLGGGAIVFGQHTPTLLQQVTSFSNEYPAYGVFPGSIPEVAEDETTNGEWWVGER